LNRGIIHSGTTRNTDTQHTLLCQALERFQKVVGTPTTIDSSQSEFHELNETISKTMQHGDVDLTIRNVRGQRYLGIGLSPEKPNEFKIRLQGFPGNCMANLNNGCTFEVFGNVADDVADTMHDGQIIIHGNARDVLGQGLQGGHIFVRGGVGNRAAIQMRAYRTHRPYLIVGETADDYLGEYMAGGVVMILNLSNALNPVGDYVGTGMVGGKIYIRGKINDAQIGMSPNKQDILNYLKASMIDSQISKTTFEKVASLDSLTESELESQLPHDLFARIRFIFFSSKYTKHLIVEHRTLQPADLELLNEKLREYSNTFELTETLLESVLESEFTIISVAEEAPATPIPPQEVPVEE